MRRLLDQFNSSNSTTEQRLNVLLELEYLVHQVTHPFTHIQPCTSTLEMLAYTHVLRFKCLTFPACLYVCVRWIMLRPCVRWGVSSSCWRV